MFWLLRRTPVEVEQSMEKATPYVQWRNIPFGDTDAAAIVYTPRFSDYCMEAVEIWFRDYVGVDWYRMNTEFGRGTPVVHMEITFKAPLIGNDRLGVVIRVVKMGRSTVTLDLEGVRERTQPDGQLTAFNARYVFCFTEKERGAIAIPDHWRAAIEAYRASSELYEAAIGEGTDLPG